MSEHSRIVLRFDKVRRLRRARLAKCPRFRHSRERSDRLTPVSLPFDGRQASVRIRLARYPIPVARACSASG